MAYKLALPPESKIHNVVHVSQLKKYSGTLPIAAHIPSWLQGSTDIETMQPRAIADRRIVKRHNVAVVQYLIQWEGFSDHESSWEDAVTFEAKFLDFMNPQTCFMNAQTCFMNAQT